MQNSHCKVPLTALYAPPYNLVGKTSVYAKVYAINYYGSSVEPDPANGAIIVYVPDAPLNFKDNTAVTSAYVIGLMWNDGLLNGGTPVIDYTVSFDQSTGVWITLAT